MRNTIQVAVGIISNSQGQLLIAKRPLHWLGGGYWEFPGGKIEPNEDSQAALKRELLEEVNIVVESCSPLISLTYDYPERTVVLHAWVVHTYTGEPKGLEGQEIAWCDAQALDDVNMLPANRAVVIATQLPDTYQITPDFSTESEVLEKLRCAIAEQNIRLLQLRSSKLSPNQYAEFARKVSDLCRETKTSLLLNYEHLELVEKINADGVHLPADQLALFDKRPLPPNKWVGVSCHNLSDIAKAEQLNVDFIVLSPVNHCPSEPEALGWDKFAKLVAAANLPVYALGGMRKQHLAKAKELGAQGIAGVRCFWESACP